MNTDGQGCFFPHLCCNGREATARLSKSVSICGGSHMQFRSLLNRRMLDISMPKSSRATNTFYASVNSQDIEAAEQALKAHILASDREILAEMTDGDGIMREIANTVDLTEAPEDAVCGLIIDLLQYCEREKIDWTQDVMSRAREHLRRNRGGEP